MTNARIWALLFVFILSINTGFSEQAILGKPLNVSFTSKDYSAGIQNWDIDQDQRSVMYFANNEGLLEFDGANWSLYPLPNKTVVRSIEIDNYGQIYIGGQNEFGCFSADERGVLRYKSLKELIPEKNREFEDVWDLSIEDSTIVFRSAGKIYILNDVASRILDDHAYRFVRRIGKDLLLQDNANRVFLFSLSKASSSVILDSTFNYQIFEVITVSENKKLVATRNGGLYHWTDDGLKKWNTSIDKFLYRNNITSAAKLSNDQLALGTQFGGVVIIDNRGKLISKISKSDGLTTGNVINVFVDSGRNMWLGLDNGIGYLQTNAPFTLINPDGDAEGIGYAVKVFNDRIYFATSSGLYQTEWNTSNMQNDLSISFSLVENSQGQTWNLDVLNNNLYLSHSNGAYLVKEDVCIPIIEDYGVWLFDSLNHTKDYVVCGTYNGIIVFENANGKLKELPFKSNFSESSRFLEQDNSGNLWISHPYKGLFKLNINERASAIDFRQYGVQDGLPSSLNNHVFKIHDEILVGAEKGIYYYNSESDVFIKHHSLNNLLSEDVKIRRLMESNNGIWFISEETIGVLKINDLGLQKSVDLLSFPNIKPLLNNGFETVYPSDENNVFIGAKKGFIHYNPSKILEEDHSFQVLIKEVMLKNPSDSLIYAGGNVVNEKPFYVHKKNIKGIKFRYSATAFIDNNQLLFRYFMEGFDESWSNWTNQNVSEFTNLPPGDYTFNIQAKRNDGVESEIRSFTFTIGETWYLKKSVRILYVVGIFLVLFYLVKNNKKKIDRVKEEADRNVRSSKQKIEELENEKVKEQLEHKSRELASSALHLARKNQTLVQITEEVKKIEKSCTDQTVLNHLMKMRKILKKEETLEDSWDNLMYHFNELHASFFNKLKSAFPSLTPKDMKLCSYLKMNLTTKEIATILNISVRAVEASRYRLRKKLNVDTHVDLTEFLMKFDKTDSDQSKTSI